MGLLDRMEPKAKELKQQGAADSAQAAEETKDSDRAIIAGTVGEDKYLANKQRIHSDIIDSMNKQNLANIDREKMLAMIDQRVNDDEYGIARLDRPAVVVELLNDIMGFGPIETLIQDPNYSEIMVNGPNQIYVEKKGKLVLTDIKFRDDQHLINVIDRIVSEVGRHVDEASPLCDARLLDGSRVNAVIPPISLKGAVLTIRKFGKKPITAENLITFGSVTPKMLQFLEACVKGKLNIIVSGGTGSGKTTLLNVLSSYIPEDERIITIEDAAEVQLKQQHVITLEARPANLEGKGAITIRNLVTNALRMRPDRIIVGEVRSQETLDMLQAMNTGHDGSLTTIHANSPRDSMARIETMVMMAGMDLPLKAIRDQVASAIDLVVQQSRLRDGSRKVTAISEVVGMEGDIISMQDIYKYETDGKVDVSGKFVGQFRATGVRPHCIEKITSNGVAINSDWFTN